MGTYSNRVKDSVFYWEEGNLVVENAVFCYRTNFAGAPTEVNPAGGKRTFSIALTEEVANDLIEGGWNVRKRPPYEEGDDYLYTTEIVVNAESKYPPSIYISSGSGDNNKLTRIPPQSYAELDGMRYENVDLIIHPYVHNRGKFSTKGYLSSMVVTPQRRNSFRGKYANYDVQNDES